MATTYNADSLQVTPEQVKSFGEFCISLADDLTNPTANLDGIAPVAGGFPHGSWLAEVIRAHRDNANETLTRLANAVRSIGDRLIRIAANYRDTEQLNNLTADALNDLMAKVNSLLPGAGPAPAA